MLVVHQQQQQRQTVLTQILIVPHEVLEVKSGGGGGGGKKRFDLEGGSWWGPLGAMILARRNWQSAARSMMLLNALHAIIESSRSRERSDTDNLPSPSLASISCDTMSVIMTFLWFNGSSFDSTLEIT